jgi:hypothetical protein
VLCCTLAELGRRGVAIELFGSAFLEAWTKGAVASGGGLRWGEEVPDEGVGVSRPAAVAATRLLLWMGSLVIYFFRPFTPHPPPYFCSLYSSLTSFVVHVGLILRTKPKASNIEYVTNQDVTGEGRGGAGYRSDLGVGGFTNLSQACSEGSTATCEIGQASVAESYVASHPSPGLLASLAALLLPVAPAYAVIVYRKIGPSTAFRNSTPASIPPSSTSICTCISCEC